MLGGFDDVYNLCFCAASPEPENTLDFSRRPSQQVNWIVVNLKLFVLNQAWCEGRVFFKTGVLFGFSRKDLHHVKWKWEFFFCFCNILSFIHLFWVLVLLCLQLTFAYEVPLLLVPFATVSILYSIVSIFDDVSTECCLKSLVFCFWSGASTANARND